MIPKQLVRLSACAVTLAMLAFSLSAPHFAQAAPAAIVVNDSSDGGTCPIFLTLRCAIDYANNPIHPGTSIRFQPGLAAIILQSSLPVITADTWIDGYDNTNSTCCQVIDGSSMSSGDALTINASFVTISHMTVVNVPSTGDDISIVGGKDIEISYSYLGILPGATQCAGLSSSAGVYVFLDLAGSAGPNNGAAYIFADTISCHAGYGVAVQGSSYVYVGTKRDGTPFGNYLGTTSDGTRAAGNAYAGVTILSNSDHVTIRDNTLSANDRGLTTASSSTISSLLIAGNKIGTSANGLLPLPNTHEGILISGGSGNVLTNNLVAYNGAAGIALTGSDTNAAIQNNDIYRNGGLPIDLGNDGPTPNDPLDADFGPNMLLDYPVVTSFIGSFVSGTACATCRVYVFKAVGNPAAPGGGGIYQTFVDVNNSGDWVVNLPNNLTRFDVTFTTEYPGFVSSEMSPRPQLFLPLIRR